MNARCLMLMTWWYAITMGGVTFLEMNGLRELAITPMVFIPWLTSTVIVLCGVLLHPEEV